MPRLTDKEMNLNNDGGIAPVAILVLISLGFLLIAGANAIFAIVKINTWTPAAGTVIELAAQHSIGGNGTTYAPKVAFTAKDGKQQTFVSNSWSNPPMFHEGEKVPVLYDSNNPEWAVRSDAVHNRRSNSGLSK
jgi:hypothetical protein